jgi:outer membrane protein TolC
VATLAQRRAGAGVGAPLEVALARGEAGAAKAGVVDAEGLETEARAELRAAMGAEPDAQIDADGELCAPAAPVLDESGSLARARRDEPALRLADARAQLAAREVDVVRATSGPTLGLSASLLREGTGDAVALAAVSFPLPFFERSDFEVSRLRGTVDLASATLARTRSELERSVRLAVHDRHHSRELYSTLRDEAHKPLASALATATAQYEAGTIDAAALLLARQRAFVVEEQVTRACGEIRRADLRWLRAVGAAEGDR